MSEWAQVITAAVAGVDRAAWPWALTMGGMVAIFAWTTRHIVRDELLLVRQDIETLRTAVFNHLSHGEAPDEGLIRRGLGYGPR